MAEIRTLYAQRTFGVGMCALIIAILSFIVGTVTLLTVTGALK